VHSVPAALCAGGLLLTGARARVNRGPVGHGSSSAALHGSDRSHRADHPARRHDKRAAKLQHADDRERRQRPDDRQPRRAQRRPGRREPDKRHNHRPLEQLQHRPRDWQHPAAEHHSGCAISLQALPMPCSCCWRTACVTHTLITCDYHVQPRQGCGCAVCRRAEQVIPVRQQPHGERRGQPGPRRQHDSHSRPSIVQPPEPSWSTWAAGAIWARSPKAQGRKGPAAQGWEVDIISLRPWRHMF